jgi:hypothetical protein
LNSLTDVKGLEERSTNTDSTKEGLELPKFHDFDDQKSFSRNSYGAQVDLWKEHPFGFELL